MDTILIKKNCPMEYLRNSYGVGIEEVFTYNEITHLDKFKFTKEYNLVCMYDNVKFTGWARISEGMWLKILKGEWTVKLLPFYPSEGDTYWSYEFSGNGDIIKVVYYIWQNTLADKLRLKNKIVFISKERADAYLQEFIAGL